MKPLKIYDDLYGRNIFVFHSWPFEKFLAYVKKHIVKDFDLASGAAGLHVAFVIRGAFLNVIWTDHRLKGVDKVTVLAHECLHATVNILTDAGVPMTPDNDESYCYYQGFLMKKILKPKSK